MITREARLELLESIIADPTEKSETRLKGLELYNELSPAQPGELPGDLTDEDVLRWAKDIIARHFGVTCEDIEALRKQAIPHE